MLYRKETMLSFGNFTNYKFKFSKMHLHYNRCLRVEKIILKKHEISCLDFLFPGGDAC